MARIHLNCACGFHYAVTEHQRPEAKCPSCGKSAGPEPAARPASDPRRRNLLLVGGIGLGVLAVAVMGLFFMARGDKSPPEEEVSKKPSSTGTASVAPGKRKVPALRFPDNVPAPQPAEPPLSNPVEPAPEAPERPPQDKVNAKNPLSAGLAQRLKDEILTLPLFYLRLVLEGLTLDRVTKLAKGAQATEEEATQVANLLGGARLDAVRNDQAKINEGYDIAHKEASEDLPVDLVKMKDGSEKHCRILEENAEFIRVEIRIGKILGPSKIPRGEIELPQKGKGIGAAWTDRWKQAEKGPPAKQQELYQWCKSNALLVRQAKLMALLLLKSDPSQPSLRDEAGLPADPIEFEEEKARGRIIFYEGRDWLAKQLKDKFLKEGYSLLEGKWFRKSPLSIEVPDLFEYERQSKQRVQITAVSAPLCHDVERVFNPNLPLAQQAAGREVRRFYAPALLVSPPQQGRKPPNLPPIPLDTAETRHEHQWDLANPPIAAPVQGEVLISVPLEKPILEASVMTRAEVKGGATITVYLALEGGQRTKLYVCAGREEGLHKLPDSIKGSRQINLAVVIQSQAAYTPDRKQGTSVSLKKNNNNIVLQRGVKWIYDRLIPDYNAVLFPSNSRTGDVFRLKGQVAEAVPQFDTLFAQCPDVLKVEAPKPGGR